MTNFDAVQYAKWLNDAFHVSPFKTQAQLAEAVGVHRSTINRYMNATEQALTGSASRPDPALAALIGEKLVNSRDKGLVAAGYTPEINRETQDVALWIADGLMKAGYGRLSEFHRRIARNQMMAIVRILAEAQKNGGLFAHPDQPADVEDFSQGAELLPTMIEVPPEVLKNLPPEKRGDSRK